MEVETFLRESFPDLSSEIPAVLSQLKGEAFRNQEELIAAAVDRLLAMTPESLDAPLEQGGGILSVSSLAAATTERNDITPKMAAIEILDDDDDVVVVEAQSSASSSSSSSIKKPDVKKENVSTAATAKIDVKKKAPNGTMEVPSAKRRIVPKATSSTNASKPVKLAGKRVDRALLANIHEQRLMAAEATTTTTPVINKIQPKVTTTGASAASASASASPSASSSSTVVGSGGNFDTWNAMQQIRREKHEKWRTTKHARQKVFTFRDIEKMQQEQWEGNSTMADPQGIGKRALTLSNEFRKKNGLAALVWNDPMCLIAVQHSKNMGERKVAFGHDGFNARVKQFPMRAVSAAENVAWSSGLADVAKVAVDGWIESPGHRKNLLSNHKYCAIGVFRTPDGRSYLTQLFAR